MEDERKRILEMLQQGTITIEQAEKLLEALQESYQAEAEPVREGSAEPQQTGGQDWNVFGRNLAEKIQRSVSERLGGQDWGDYGRNLAEMIQTNITAALSGVSGAFAGWGKVENEAGQTQESDTRPQRESYSPIRLSRGYLERLPDNTVFINYGPATITPDVPVELLERKISEYHNYGPTSGPAPLIYVLMDRCPANYGPFQETDEGTQDERPQRYNSSHVQMTRKYLERMQDGTVFHNSGHVEVSRDVTEDILAQKIAEYYNMGHTECPSHLIGFFENRFSAMNTGVFEETGYASVRPVAPETEVVITESTSGSGKSGTEAILMELDADAVAGWQELAIKCYAGNLDLQGGQDTFRIIAVSPHEAAPDDWVKDIGLRTERKGSKQIFILGVHDDPAETADMTFRFEIPVEIAVHARTEQGNVSADSLMGDASLETGAGDITASAIAGAVHMNSGRGNLAMNKIMGDVHLNTGGGNIALNTIEGTASCNTGSGDIACNTISGDATINSGGGEIAVRSIAGNVNANTGGGSIAAKDVTGDIALNSGGGDMTCRDIAGSATISTGGGDITFVEIAGAAHVNTGGGDITFKDISGDVKADTGGGDITCKGVSGQVNVSTGGGDITAKGVEGDAALITHGGDITAIEISGNVICRTDGGDIQVSDIDGDAVLETGDGDISQQNVSGSVTIRKSR